MKAHPYLRAYMAGIVLPTIFLLFILLGFLVTRDLLGFPIPIERVIVFPMALVPNLWGLWNILYVGLRHHRRLPLGLHGALLALLALPVAAVAMKLRLGLPGAFTGVFLVALPVVLIAYYLLWKYVVGFLNRFMGIDGELSVFNSRYAAQGGGR